MNAKGGSLALDMGFDIILCEKGLTAAHVKSKALRKSAPAYSNCTTTHQFPFQRPQVLLHRLNVAEAGPRYETRDCENGEGVVSNTNYELQNPQSSCCCSSPGSPCQSTSEEQIFRLGCMQLLNTGSPRV